MYRSDQETCVVTEAPGVDSICWNLASAPWPSSDRLLTLVVVLRGTPDIDAVDLIEELSLMVVTRDEQVAAMREVESVTLKELHAARREITRLQDRLIELRGALRRRKAAA